MRQYKCLIKEFLNITPSWSSNVEYRMQIETIPAEKINQSEEKQYRKIYQVNIFCSGPQKVIWRFSNNDLEKVLCEYARRLFEEKFSKGAFPESGTLDLVLDPANTPNSCPYDPNKIKCYQNYTFPVEVERKIGFRKK
ncbi:MAG: hypothetical protein MUP17_05950 [candidate division Zixibacteria bacterium]|nr:hypothetical protein [candidate division Zixibacteria bacterium]